jgi:trimethylamine:corrinoid methyltransferase-like protein
VEPGGHFLDQPSTLQYCRKAFRSTLFKPYVHEAGKSDDLKDVIERARQRTLDNWNADPDPKWLNNETAAELDRIVNKAEGALAC